ncbi:MAG: PrgI family protein [Candidatus Uhrbacteria bacterium]|nr:PrgI family protein [Candidatus Uhrbacteria bacterium]
MDQITVPQFIENEDRILGPITVRQFVIILVACALIFVAYKTTDLTAFIFSAILIVGCAGVLGFVRINGQPFHFFILNVARTASRPTLRVWRKDVRRVIRSAKETKEEKAQKEIAAIQPPRVTGHRLADIALIVDTGGAYMGEKEKESELF